MLALKVRRASDYVPAPTARQQAAVIALADDGVIGPVDSPARRMQAELAARLTGEAVVDPGRSLRWRMGAICGAAILCWVPLVGAMALIFV
jgi:hypothetical protein